MIYRADIDGLRALSVIAVILFHSGFPFASAGFIGVDVFFVISGFLITSLLRDETTHGNFSFGSFYRRRAARLIPALLVTLAGTLAFGFLFYDNRQLDNLGKEITFSAFGIANLLFAQGKNYFASEAADTPLLHLWSLGVEEQFYLVWPIFMLLAARWNKASTWITTAIFFSLSLAASTIAAKSAPTAAYFLPQYRVFELLVGALLSIGGLPKVDRQQLRSRLSAEILSTSGIVLIGGSLMTLTEDSVFPGTNALWPCAGTALILAYSPQTWVGRFLSLRPLVAMGLISYPLYLYHQPILSWYRYFEPDGTSISALLILVFSAIPLATLTFLYVEKPIRRLAHNQSSRIGARIPLVLGTALVTIGIVGFGAAKQNGWPYRFKLLNPFAFAVSENHSASFHESRQRGSAISVGDHGKILFVGDSVLQQYVEPMATALGIRPTEIDSVTRGGCVLLKGVDFDDQFSDISCNEIRAELYSSPKTYDYVVLSQHWASYASSILNQDPAVDSRSLEKWTPFIEETLEHFSGRATTIVILGEHPKVVGTNALKPSIFLNEEDYKKSLADLQLLNGPQLTAAQTFFSQFKTAGQIVLDLEEVWCDAQTHLCELHNGTWSFFSDPHHITVASTPFLVERFNNLIPGANTSRGR